MYVTVTQVSTVTRPRILQPWETQWAVRRCESACDAGTLSSLTFDGLLTRHVLKTDVFAHTPPFAFWMSVNGSSLHWGSNCENLPSHGYTFPVAAHLYRHLVLETYVRTHSPIISFPAPWPPFPLFIQVLRSQMANSNSLLSALPSSEICSSLASTHIIDITHITYMIMIWSCPSAQGLEYIQLLHTLVLVHVSSLIV